MRNNMAWLRANQGAAFRPSTAGSEAGSGVPRWSIERILRCCLSITKIQRCKYSLVLLQSVSLNLFYNQRDQKFADAIAQDRKKFETPPQ